MTTGCAAAFRVVNEPRNTSGPIAEFQPSLTDYIRLRRIFLSVQGFSISNPLVLGIGTPASAGTGRLNIAALLQEDAGDSQQLPGLRIFIDWTIFPTIPTTFFRRIILQITTGNGNILSVDFPNGLGVPAGGSLVLWSIAQGIGTGLMYDISVEFDA